DLDRLIIAVIIDYPLVFYPPALGHEDVQKGIGDTVLQLVEPPGLNLSAGLVQIGGIQYEHHLGASLVDILVLEVLGMGQDVHLAEQGVGSGDEIVGAAGDDGAPAAPGDVREAYVIAVTCAAEEEG